MSNPWKAQHLAAEMACTEDGNDPAAAQMLDAEYEGTDELTRPCRCGTGTLYGRASIGAMQCDSCNTLARIHGTYYRPA